MSANKKRILIIGATGGTGKKLVSQALERGYRVTALVRNPAKLKIHHEQLDIVKGDVLDFVTLEKTVRGHDAVISALGHKRWFFPSKILSEGTLNIINAMQVHDVKRLICQTSLGVGDSRGRMGLYYTLFTIPFILYFYFRDKELQEKYIRDSDLDWTIVRPGALNNRGRRGTYKHGEKVGSYLWTVRISRADVADFMLNQLTDDQYLHATPGICW